MNKGLSQNSSLKNSAQNPEPFWGKTPQKGFRVSDFSLFFCAGCYRVFILQQTFFFVCMKKIIVDFQTNHQYTIIVKCLFISADEQYLSLIAILYSAVPITNNTVFMYSHGDGVFIYLFII